MIETINEERNMKDSLSANCLSMINDITEKGKLRASHKKQTHKMRAKQNSSNQSKKIYHYHLVLSGQNKYIAENIKVA